MCFLYLSPGAKPNGFWTTPRSFIVRHVHVHVCTCTWIFLFPLVFFCENINSFTEKRSASAGLLNTVFPGHCERDQVNGNFNWVFFPWLLNSKLSRKRHHTPDWKERDISPAVMFVAHYSWDWRGEGKARAARWMNTMWYAFVRSSPESGNHCRVVPALWYRYYSVQFCRFDFMIYPRPGPLITPPFRWVYVWIDYSLPLLTQDDELEEIIIRWERRGSRCWAAREFSAAVVAIRFSPGFLFLLLATAWFFLQFVIEFHALVSVNVASSGGWGFMSARRWRVLENYYCILISAVSVVVRLGFSFSRSLTANRLFQLTFFCPGGLLTRSLATGGLRTALSHLRYHFH